MPNIRASRTLNTNMFYSQSMQPQVTSIHKSTQQRGLSSHGQCMHIVLFQDNIRLIEPRYEKNCFFAIAKTKAQKDASNCASDQRLCFPWIAQFLFYLNSKFQASSHLLRLYSLVCVRPGLKPRRPVFSQRSSIIL